MIDPTLTREDHLERELASTKRRLAEVEKERDDWRKESDANARFIADMVRDGITRDKLTALRNAADGMQVRLEMVLNSHLHVDGHMRDYIKRGIAAYAALISEGAGR